MKNTVATRILRIFLYIKLREIVPVAAFKKLVAAFKKLVATCGDCRQYWTDVSLKCEISNESLKKDYYRLMKTHV